MDKDTRWLGMSVLCQERQLILMPRITTNQPRNADTQEFVVVPKEPTDEMLMAAHKLPVYGTFMREIWQAMIAAAPMPEREG